MENQLANNQNKGMASTKTVAQFFDQKNVQSKFEALLGARGSQFISAVMAVVNGNDKLKNADPTSIYACAIAAATLDLSVNPNLGQAYIVPYGKSAQFQVGTRGYIQLAIRTSLYENLNAVEIYENQYKSYNSLTEEIVLENMDKPQGKVVGFAAYFKLTNGYTKTIYWSKEKCLAHAVKYSKTYNFGPWKTDEIEMCKKTVIKHILVKWGALSVEYKKQENLVTALKYDQAVVTTNGLEEADIEDINFTYDDNPNNDAVNAEVKDKEITKKVDEEVDMRWTMLIENANSVDILDNIKNDPDMPFPKKFIKAWDAKYKAITDAAFNS